MTLWQYTLNSSYCDHLKRQMSAFNTHCWTNKRLFNLWIYFGFQIHVTIQGSVVLIDAWQNRHLMTKRYKIKCNKLGFPWDPLAEPFAPLTVSKTHNSVIKVQNEQHKGRVCWITCTCVMCCLVVDLYRLVRINQIWHFQKQCKCARVS